MPAKPKKTPKTKKSTSTKKIPVKTSPSEEEANQSSDTSSLPGEHSDLIIDTLNQLLEHLQIPAQADINYDPESEYYYLQVETENPGILIGYRGDTLSALQTMLNFIIQTSTHTWPRVVINIGDYRQRREETLVNLARNAAQRVKFSGQSYTFGPLTPAERRIIHMTLSEDPDITTYSEGEHRHRRLVVAPK